MPTRSNRSDSAPGSIERAFAIVRLLSGAGPRGAALTDVARQLGLPHPTVHRLLHKLIGEGIVRQFELDRRYALGRLAFELGLAASRQFDIRALCRPHLERLAIEAGDTSYLVWRSGSEAVCIDLFEGPSPIRVLTLQAGSRRPLGVGAGGLAILAALPAEDRRAVMNDVMAGVEKHWGLSRAFFTTSIERTNRDGYALIRNRVTAGVSAIGLHLTDPLGAAVGAVSIASISSRLTTSRLATLHGLLVHCARGIEKALRHKGEKH